MKGLLLKDVWLTLANKRVLIFVVFFGVLLLVMGNMDTFLVGYITLLFTMQVLSSITYDDYDKSVMFLFTLPVSRRQYVIEKYVFALIGMAIGWCASVCAVKLKDLLYMPSPEEAQARFMSYAAILAVALLFAGFGIPIRLKFGSENGRMVTWSIAVIGILAVFFGIRMLNRSGFDADLLGQRIVSHSSVLIPGLIAGFVVLFLVSVFASLRVVQKKEF